MVKPMLTLHTPFSCYTFSPAVTRELKRKHIGSFADLLENKKTLSEQCMREIADITIAAIRESTAQMMMVNSAVLGMMG